MHLNPPQPQTGWPIPGTCTRPVVKVGETVRVDQPLFEASTDKVDTEIPSPATGKLVKILVDENQTAQFGVAVAVISSSR
ncbi:biotin/lipoyl-containing protein [Streptomyces sp. NPDC055966]|uniref:biotin/lipoyl-containing protein n=1 Tax=Streptomyces sp. NPDC055966 TaxID=3345669 RepID=UPI0035DD0C77